MTTRRNFIKSSAATISAAFLSPALFKFPEGKRLKNFGFISGIIDKELKGNWKEVLEKVASFGYTEIETGSFPGDSAQSFLSFLSRTGISPVAGTLDFNAGDDDLKKGMSLINSLNMKYAVVYWPWFTGGPFNIGDCRRSADRLNFLGKLCSDNGLVLCWHNHNKEFIAAENGLPFDFLMNHTDRDMVKCELDIYWVKKGGADPLSVLKKYPGRFEILHVKDMAPGPDMDFECPGSGIIDFPSIFREADKQHISHYMVERDNAVDGMECLRSSAEYLRNLQF